MIKLVIFSSGVGKNNGWSATSVVTEIKSVGSTKFVLTGSVGFVKVNLSLVDDVVGMSPDLASKSSKKYASDGWNWTSSLP